MFTTKSLFKYFLRATVAVALVTTVSKGAAAASPEETASTEVRVISTHGLDLTSPGGREELRQRITRASRQVCAAVTNGYDPGDANYRDCYQSAFADGWKQAEVKIAAAEKQTKLASAAMK